MRRVILLVWVLGCGGGDGSASEGGAGGTPPAATGGAVASAGQGGVSATGGSAGSGGTNTGGTTGGAGGTQATGGSGAGGASMPDSGSAPDSGGSASYASCSQGVVNSSACGYLDANSRYVSFKKDGHACVICFPRDGTGNPDLTKSQVTGCLVSPGAGQVGLCVMACGECK